MSDAVLVGLLSLVGTVIGSLAGIVSTQRVTACRLEQLQKEVARHNGLIDRTYHLEARMAMAENELRMLNGHADMYGERRDTQ